MNLNQTMIKNRAANPAVFSRAQSFYNSGGKIQYYVTYDPVDLYQIFAEVEDDILFSFMKFPDTTRSLSLKYK